MQAGHVLGNGLDLGFGELEGDRPHDVAVVLAHAKLRISEPWVCRPYSITLQRTQDPRMRQGQPFLGYHLSPGREK